MWNAENLMSGHRIVFDRERMILGWKQSNCKFLNQEVTVYT